ncbi:hypothetical protein HYFRA_00008512 [Hymenoscyphus fraxineus]|uniref:Secreted protein n=1 Tax=Hymenoscyphus fraxineus TaxID=746836 RepID=A0A9N9KZI6_9HELO|nr:hypothetical protein HYFRA_00008512 [Hymenoscyphus fraxineus]
MPNAIATIGALLAAVVVSLWCCSSGCNRNAYESSYYQPLEGRGPKDEPHWPTCHGRGATTNYGSGINAKELITTTSTTTQFVFSSLRINFYRDCLCCYRYALAIYSIHQSDLVEHRRSVPDSYKKRDISFESELHNLPRGVQRQNANDTSTHSAVKLGFTGIGTKEDAYNVFPKQRSWHTHFPVLKYGKEKVKEEGSGKKSRLEVIIAFANAAGVFRLDVGILMRSRAYHHRKAMPIQGPRKQAT